jgi:hypothetical protein
VVVGGREVLVTQIYFADDDHLARSTPPHLVADTERSSDADGRPALIARHDIVLPPG